MVEDAMNKLLLTRTSVTFRFAARTVPCCLPPWPAIVARSY